MTITSTRRRFFQGTAVVGGLGALAACSQQSSEEQADQAAEENDQAMEEASELPNTGWERAEYDQVEDGGTLRLAVNQLPNTWNYYHTNGALADLSDILDPMWPGSFRASETGEVELNPDTVVSAEITSEDPQIVTVKYNPEGVWEDGTPITIQDFISQWKACSGSDEAYEVGSTTGWADIADVRETDDEFTGEIEYTSTFPDWIQYLYPSLPQEVTADAESFNEGYVTTPTPSYGPFKVDNVDQTGEVVTMTRNENWWGQAPKLETIIFSVVSQAQMPSTFANSEIDVIDIADGDTYSQAAGRSDAVLQKTNGVTWTHVTLNVTGEDNPLADIAVREALARAINRDAVGQAVVGPLEAPVVPVDNYIFMPGQDGYEDSFEAGTDAPLTYDPEAANALLDEAGWALNGEVREKDGKQLTLSVTVPADVKSNSDRARQIQTDLNAVGFSVELTTVPSDAYFDEYIDTGDFEMVTFSWIGTLFPQQSSANLFYPADSGQNYTGLDLDDQLADLADTMQTELDPEARMAASNEFSSIVAASFSVIPFYATPVVFGVAEGVVNFGASLFETVDWTTVGFKAA
ncbi:ABC transporter family substrate-binding protein [Brachybacterium sp. YJGR34]|uniref:ABC transporter family substrate-binding protein n=1 Tax=Brachybacterium sp. YJGR34 TaxID=2059911 RepID=UPI000E0B44A5|nr:ABC transporter family substrate-binding protein [Brachybacterium sp. YJGR34]